MLASTRLRRTATTAGRDRTEELPDEIHASIISFLPLWYAVRTTSLVSKRWRFTWTSRSDLKLDYHNVLGGRHHRIGNTCAYFTMRQRLAFVNSVDSIMRRLSMGGKIKSLAVHFHLGNQFSSRIDDWIDCAVLKGVESIDLDFSEFTCFRNAGVRPYPFELYEFRPSLLGDERNIKQLRLSSCIFSAPLSCDSLKSLISVELRCVSINNELLMALLSSCLRLKKLSLQQCKDLVNLKFTDPSHPLEFLKVKDCFGINEIEISSKNLTRLEYTGHPINFYFKQVPKLTEVFLSYTGKNRIDGVTYALTKLPSKLPRLEKLNLFSILSMKALELPDNGPVFKNLKQLVLTIYPFYDAEKLGWIAYILRTFPLLQKLQLNLFSPSFVRPSMKIEKLLPEIHHVHLTELEINGFYGYLHEVELLMYLVESLTSLRRLLVRTNQKVFKGFDSWVYEETQPFYKKHMKEAPGCSWLHKLVPKTIHLEVQ